MLSLYSLLRHWCVVGLPQAAPQIHDHREAFLAACSAVDVILWAKRGGIALADAGRRLRRCMARHMTFHMRARGAQAARPKHHWAFDVADQLCSDAFVFDCFVVERLHLRVKACAEHIKNTRRFEWSALSSVVNSHASQAAKLRVQQGLVGKTASTRDFPNAAISDNCEVKGFRCSVGDLVFCNEDCGKVVACCVEAGELFVVVDELQQATKWSHHSGRWSPLARRHVWRADCLSEAAAWQRMPDGNFVVVRM